MAKSVVTEGGVTATPTTSLFTGAQSGKWTAGTISYGTDAKLRVGGAKVIHTASCTFSFAGANASGTAVAGTEAVELKAKTTLLQKGGPKVIVDGDSASGSTYGNKLQAASSKKLKTG